VTLLDETPMSKFHRRAVLVAGVGFFTDAYDLFVISTVGVLVQAQWHLSTSQTSWVEGAAILGAFVGALVFGRIADLIGRRRVFALVAAGRKAPEAAMLLGVTTRHVLPPTNVVPNVCRSYQPQRGNVQASSIANIKYIGPGSESLIRCTCGRNEDLLLETRSDEALLAVPGSATHSSGRTPDIAEISGRCKRRLRQATHLSSEPP